LLLLLLLLLLPLPLARRGKFAVVRDKSLRTQERPKLIK
jgi:hypothetical protein